MACATTWPRQRRSYVRLQHWAMGLAVTAALCISARASAYEIVAIGATRPAGAAKAALQAELFKPKGNGPFPAVVLMHGCGGWQSAVLSGLHSHTQYFLDHGYAVLNLDSFGSRGTSGGTVCESTARLVRALDYRTYDAFDALRYMRSLSYVDKDNIFLMGQSNGGSVAINAAKNRRHDGYRAVAAYYPWCGSLGGANVKLSAPLIIFSGGRDDWVPAQLCRHKHAIGASLKVVEYASAAHSFDLPIESQRYLGKLIGFNPSATADSRARMLAFFDSNLSKPPVATKTPAAKPASFAVSLSPLEGADASWFE
ncbi:dienelactone hydrolase family protein [Microbacteriaceae bacterium K1510]|nr:dienelactone hydrolase family protein [Microbacteriaceae bacterium K1510]